MRFEFTTRGVFCVDYCPAAADTSSAAANPVVDDMSITLLPGRYKHLTMIDRPEGLAPPPLVFFHLGGPAASRAAADPVWDEIALCNLVSAEAMAESIATTRNDR